MDIAEIGLRSRRQHQRGGDGVDANAAAGQRAGGQFGESGQRLLGQRVAEEIGVRRGKLRVEQIDDQRAARRGLRKGLDEQSGRARIDRHVRVELGRRKVREIVRGETGRIVDQQPRRLARRRDDQGGRARIGEVRDDPHRPVRHAVGGVVDMGDDAPARRHQCFGNGRPDALARAGNDRRSWCLAAHAADP